MNDYVIFADSACDIATDILDKWQVKYFELQFAFDDEEKIYGNYELDAKSFYDKMRSGRTAKTSAINIETFKAGFEEALKEGKDVLYLCFSGGLSGTYNASRIAAEELSEVYTDRKIITVDTLCCSAGCGMLLYLTVEEKNKGATIEEAAEFAENTKLSICHWFTVDDLAYLKRGGRISPTVALAGSILGIKPVLHMDNEGHLVNKFKVRGRKAALNAIVDKIGELAVDPTMGPVFICHGDCMNDVEYIKKSIYDKYGIKVGIIADIGPVVGSHSGPGTIAVFFVGKER